MKADVTTTVTCPNCGQVITVPVDVDLTADTTMRFTPVLHDARRHIDTCRSRP